uniref:Uncharacterized protein n=1 Tax=Anguilla anguilla TaxID=7936 RepID=A0A0E9U9F7_ANGAN
MILDLLIFYTDVFMEPDLPNFHSGRGPVVWNSSLPSHFVVTYLILKNI